MNTTKPNYKKIYSDIISAHFPEKENELKSILAKDELSCLDVIQLNNKLFGNQTPKHKSYDKPTILQILSHQKTYNLNNTELAHHFQLSRNTVTKWKKMFRM